MLDGALQRFKEYINKRKTKIRKSRKYKRIKKRLYGYFR